MNTLAIIPARTGSKGLTGKNQRTINNVTLTMRALMTAEEVTPYVLLSSDDDFLLREATDAGFVVHVPIEGDIHTDTCRAWDVWQEAVHWYENYLHIEQWPKRFDHHLYLEPTSPQRTPLILRHCLKLLTDHSQHKPIESVATVSPVPIRYHAYKQLECGATGRVLNPHGFDLNNPPRQTLPLTYIRNGLCYACTDHYVKKSKSIIQAKRTYLVKIGGEVINIDTEQDLIAVRRLLDHATEPLKFEFDD